MSQDFKGSDLMPWEEMTRAIKAFQIASVALKRQLDEMQEELASMHDEVAALNEVCFDVQVSTPVSTIYGVCKQCDRETMLNVAGVCEGCSLEGQING